MMIIMIKPSLVLINKILVDFTVSADFRGKCREKYYQIEEKLWKSLTNIIELILTCSSLSFYDIAWKKFTALTFK